ncbi:hypothetical protein BC629DRAFT_1437859 [Irpex lacteus]|nr:hypothetical protein BC629DRAFT_1437859 [Irpex lacteus]
MPGSVTPTLDRGPVSASDVEFSDLTNFIQVAMIAVCLYDCFLTLPREVAFVWQRKFSIASWLFLVNKYATLFCTTLRAVELVTWNPDEPHMADTVSGQTWATEASSGLSGADRVPVDVDCKTTERILDALTILIHVVFALFAAIRTSAIWGKDLRIFSVVLIFGLAFPTMYITALHLAQVAQYLKPCLGIMVLGTSEQLTYIVLAAGTTILFECVTIAFTWLKTIPAVRGLRRVKPGSTVPVIYVIFYDGTLQFIVILLLNCACLLGLAWAPLDYLFGASDVLTSIIVSRFILDLRGDHVASSQYSEGGSYYVSDVSGVFFASYTVAVWAPLNALFSLSDVLISIIISRFILDLKEDHASRSRHTVEEYLT